MFRARPIPSCQFVVESILYIVNRSIGRGVDVYEGVIEKSPPDSQQAQPMIDWWKTHYAALYPVVH
jgi:hypothetical protein